MHVFTRAIAGAALLGSACVATVPPLVSPAAAATEIEIVVNNQAITNFDIQRRAAFLRLQRAGGNLNEKAREQLVEEALKREEIARLGMSVSQSEVDAAYKRFAESNNMSVSQLEQVLTQSGVGVDHFKDYIAVNMSWSRVLRARYQAEEQLSEQDIVAKMLEQGGEKPSTTEYILQQVIFVVPDSRRDEILNARRREAEAMRARFQGCDNTIEFAKRLKDVSVRDLGRVLQPELPPEWKELVEATPEGEATRVRTTERGVEFIGVCSAKQVSDDKAAQMVFRSQQGGEEAAQELEEKYLKELRERARIAER